MGLWFGVRLGGDSGRYIGAAQNILEGLPLTNEQLHYLSYEYILLPIYALGGGTKTITVVQCFFALAGALAIYLLGKKVFSRSIGLLASVVFLLHPSIQRWNFYILTEGLATNTLLVTTAFCLTAENKITRGGYFFIAAGILALSRPESPVFLIPLTIYLISEKKPLALLWGIALVLLMVGIWVLRPPLAAEFGVWKQWKEGVYIWGYPGVGSPLSSHEEAFRGENVFAWALAMIYHPIWFIKLSAYKVYYFLLPVRPYYSTLHNLIAVSATFPLYPLAVFGTIKGKRKESMTIWGLIFVQCMLVSLTWSDWDNRWLDRITPFLLLLASGGAAALVKQWKVRRNIFG